MDMMRSTALPFQTFLPPSPTCKVRDLLTHSAHRRVNFFIQSTVVASEGLEHHRLGAAGCSLQTAVDLWILSLEFHCHWASYHQPSKTPSEKEKRDAFKDEQICETKAKLSSSRSDGATRMITLAHCLKVLCNVFIISDI